MSDSTLGVQEVDDAADELRKAMRRAFDLGQTYWMHADSESTIQHQKADRVRERFDALMEETIAATCGVETCDGGGHG